MPPKNKSPSKSCETQNQSSDIQSAIPNLVNYLRPDKFACDPDDNNAEINWTHWKYTFNNFLSESSEELPDYVKLKLLTNHLSAKVYLNIRESKTYNEALSTLDSIYVKKKNDIYARHILATHKQNSGESIDQYVSQLKECAQACTFKDIKAEDNKSELIRDGFIAGISCNKIRQRLLEIFELTLEQAVHQAKTLEMAESNSRSYTHASDSNVFHGNAITPSTSPSVTKFSDTNWLHQ